MDLGTYESRIVAQTFFKKLEIMVKLSLWIILRFAMSIFSKNGWNDSDKISNLSRDRYKDL